MYVVRSIYTDGTVMHLRGTVWTWPADRATRYATRDAAQEALETQKKFLSEKSLEKR